MLVAVPKGQLPDTTIQEYSGYDATLSSKTEPSDMSDSVVINGSVLHAVRDMAQRWAV